MHLRIAEIEEFESIRKFYWNLIDQMADQNDTIGWKKGIYPTDAFLSESLERKELYVLDGENDRYAAAVIINSLWNEGYEGCPWKIDYSHNKIMVPHALAVAPDLQGKGIGKIVVQNIIDMAKKTDKKAIRLDILKGNLAAEKLYTKMGFQYVQEKEMFYEDTGRTMYVMYEYVL